MSKQTNESAPKKKASKKTAKKAAKKTVSKATSSAAAPKANQPEMVARSVESSPTPQAAPATSGGSKGGGKGLGITALLLSLLALGAGGYAAYQTTLSSQLTTGHVSGMDERVKLVATDQATLKSGFADVESRFKALDQSVTEQFKQVDTRFGDTQKLIDNNASELEVTRAQSTQTLNNLKGDLTERIAGWKLDEVRALLMMVGQRLRWSGDAALAARGLSNADQTLAQMNDASLDAVRTKIAEEVAALRAVEPVDVTRIHNQLGVLEREIAALPLKQDAVVKQVPAAQADSAQAGNTAEGTAEKAGAANWLASTGQALLSDLGEMVKVDNIDATPAPALDEQAQFVVKTALQLRLQEAQIALLKGNDTAYAAALQAAQAWLGEHYDVQTAAVKAWADELAGLGSVRMAMSPPDISGSLIELDKAIRARQ